MFNVISFKVDTVYVEMLKYKVSKFKSLSNYFLARSLWENKNINLSVVIYSRAQPHGYRGKTRKIKLVLMIFRRSDIDEKMQQNYHVGS